MRKGDDKEVKKGLGGEVCDGIGICGKGNIFI
jgi:hypothetical protein